MIHKTRISSLLILMLIFASCTSKTEAPDEVLEQFLVGLSKCDFENAKELSTGELKESFQHANSNDCSEWEAEIISIDCEIDGDYAECSVKSSPKSSLSDTAALTFIDTYSLKKIDGNWKVSDYFKSIDLSEEQMEQLYEDNLAEPDWKNGLEFINQYVEFSNSKTSNDELLTWIKNCDLVTDDFINSLKKIIDEANENDPEMGLDYDPIFNAQDYPDKGFVIESTDLITGILYVKGIAWPDFKLQIQLVSVNNKWLVNRCGDVNPE